MVSTAVILFCTCAAFVAGFIDSIAGGGGLITIPALLLSGLPPQLALCTNKLGCCLGTGVVQRTAEVAVSATGSVVALHVSDGDRVERGQLLFTCVEAETMEDALSGGELRATAGGVVASVKVEPGQQVAVGATVLTVYPREGFCAELTVEEADLGQIAVGDSVRLSFDFDAEGALTCDGVVTEISYLGQDTEAGMTYTAYVAFDVPEGVRLGMTVTATVTGDE